MLTNDETREAKKICVECLNKIDVGSYNLRYADPRLDVYARTLIDDPDAHNLYELLALQRFFRFFGSLEKSLDGRFLRCHQSYIVNMDEVSEVSHFFTMVSGAIVPIRQRELAKIREKYENYVIGGR